MWLKRLSRSRSNSQSYVDTYRSPHDSKANSQTYDDKYANQDVNSPTDGTAQHQRPSSSRQSNTGPRFNEPSQQKDAGMYPRQSQAQEVYSPPVSAGARGGGGMNGYSHASMDTGASPTVGKTEPAPDLLLQAFNQAVRPYSNKIEALEQEISEMRAWIEQLESQRGEVHAWIDKRGLRPDVPPGIAQQMDSSQHEANPTHAAATLNAQLDRKITIVNFDLHRLQDDLNDSLPTPSFSACMLKFLPDIARLSGLASGPRYAFDLLLKLGGNLNSHGGLENGDEEDLSERRAFYARLDGSMVEVVRGRFKEEGDSWGVSREIKRIEKTGAYLRNWGVEPYFPRTLEVMREGSGMPQQATGGAAAPQNYD